MKQEVGQGTGDPLRPPLISGEARAERFASARLSASTVHDAETRLREFAEESRISNYWLSLLTLGTSNWGSVGGAVAVADQPIVLESAERLARWLRGAPSSVRISEDRAGVSGKSQAASEEIWPFVQGLPFDIRLAADVLLRRALHPFEALITIPLEELFDSGTVRRLLQSRMPGPAMDHVSAWRPGHDMQYQGYVCVIIKATRLCNLRCTYCHDWRAGQDHTMPINTAAHLFRAVLGRSRRSVIDFVWHGGEPTLIGKSGFFQFLFLQRWFAQPGQTIHNTLQTNGTTIDREWAELFDRFLFRVGVSLDGPPLTHDKTRVDKSGRPTYARAARGLRLLRDAGVLDGAIVVATDTVVEQGAAALVKFCIDEGITGVSVLPVRPEPGAPRAEPYISAPAYARFLLDLDEARQHLRASSLAIREVDAARRAVEGSMAGYCEMLGGCVGHFFSVDPDGTIWHCDKYTGELSYRVGNVLVDDLEAVCASSNVAALKEAGLHAASDFQGCEYYRFCRGWCPYEGFVGRKFGIGTPGCCGLRDLFAGLRGATRPSQVPP